MYSSASTGCKMNGSESALGAISDGMGVVNVDVDVVVVVLAVNAITRIEIDAMTINVTGYSTIVTVIDLLPRWQI